MRALAEQGDFYSNKERTILGEVTHSSSRTSLKKEIIYAYVYLSERDNLSLKVSIMLLNSFID